MHKHHMKGVVVKRPKPAEAAAMRRADAWDRVSGAYKRRSQVTSAVVAVFVVGMLNVDSFKVFKQLNAQPSVAQALAAQPLLKSPDVNATGSGIGADIDKINAQFRRFRVGSGGMWVWARMMRPFPFWQNVFGLPMTAIATSPGAPFWFDALSKLANLRSAGAKPDGS